MNDGSESSYLKHYYGLDIIKIVASVCIIFHHYQQISGVRFKYINFYGSIPFQRLVELFFLISGVLIYISDSKSKSKYASSKLIKRVLHFYPVTIIAFLVIFLVGELQYLLFQSFPTAANYHDLKTVITSITLTHRGWPFINVEHGINNPTWYLCVLIVCYIIYYLFLQLEKKLSVKIEWSTLGLFILVVLLDSMNIRAVYFGGRTPFEGLKCFSSECLLLMLQDILFQFGVYL